MQYVSLVLLSVGLVLLGLNLGGIAPGAGGFANVAFLGSLISIVAHGISESIHSHRPAHNHR